jgi:hypothetical protein
MLFTRSTQFCGQLRDININDFHIGNQLRDFCLRKHLPAPDFSSSETSHFPIKINLLLFFSFARCELCLFEQFENIFFPHRAQNLFAQSFTPKNGRSGGLFRGEEASMGQTQTNQFKFLTIFILFGAHNSLLGSATHFP